MNSIHGIQVGVLARRAMLKTLRQPFQLFPIVFFPLILLAVNASGLKAATRLPGFPTSSYISFAIAVAFIQGGMFSLINTGTNLAEDIESGFFNRLALTPLRLADPRRAWQPHGTATGRRGATRRARSHARPGRSSRCVAPPPPAVAR